MNEEFELITVTISLAATAMNENNCRTATGKPAFSSVMQSMSRHVGEKKFFRTVYLNIYEIKLALYCFIFALASGQRCLFRRYDLGLDEQAFLEDS